MPSQCEVVSCTINTPIGPYEVQCCSMGIHGLQLNANVTNENFLALGRKEVGLVKPASSKHAQLFHQILQWMKVYFSAESPNGFPEVSICHQVVDPLSSDFKHRVLTTLKNEVEFGETISYGQLAKLSGFVVGCARGVGTVMANNPVPLVIPCHRVIKSSGEHGNYSKGSKNDIKEWLLVHEKKPITKICF